MSVPNRLCMFVASFTPLWFILIGSYLTNPDLAGPDSDGSGRPIAVLVSFAMDVAIVVCIMASSNAVAGVRDDPNMERVEPSDVRDVTHSHAPSILVYTVFVAVGVASSYNLFLLLSIVGFVCLVLTKTNILLVNPSMLLVGFRIYEMKVDKPDREITLITKRPPLDGKPVHIKMAAPGVFMDRPDPGPGGWVR